MVASAHPLSYRRLLKKPLQLILIGVGAEDSHFRCKMNTYVKGVNLETTGLDTVDHNVTFKEIFEYIWYLFS